MSREGLRGEAPPQLQPGEHLRQQEAAQLVPPQRWWNCKLKYTNLELSDLCIDIAKTRAIATLTSVLLPSAPLAEASPASDKARLREAEASLGVLLSNGMPQLGFGGQASAEHEHAHTHTRARAHARARARAHAHTRPHIHAYTHAHTRKRTRQSGRRRPASSRLATARPQRDHSEIIS